MENENAEGDQDDEIDPLNPLNEDANDEAYEGEDEAGGGAAF